MSGAPAARALIFDFNGTLSDDEDIMELVTAEALAPHARPPTHEEYVERLAGLSDEAMVREWLGDRDDVDEIVAARIDGYCRRMSDGATITAEMREVVRWAASVAPVAIVSGAARAEIQPVIEAAEIADLFLTVVTSDDLEHGKPHPEGYLIALERLRDRLPDLAAGDVAVMEDTEAGVLAAKAAGMRCLALIGTMPAERLAAADELIERIDLGLVRRLLGFRPPA
ncbi:MAG TPA: HAD family phosphatase [Gaiellales bacterium]|nr:HAD family phosphatase [Gaiellales bacterium]